MTAFGWEYLREGERETILRGVRDGVAYGGPYHVEFHPADRCNIECFFCSTAAIRGNDEFPITRFGALLGELRELGTRSIRLAGGGEPLFHRQIDTVLSEIESSGLRIENITTNGVLLLPKIIERLVRTCDFITISLNTADEKTYASMMRTPERNFHRVVKNVEALVAARNADRRSRLKVNVQFLVWKENFRSIPQMYELARSMGADTILFGGLAFLRPEQHMTAAETEEMFGLYRELLRKDEYRTIRVVESYEQDISARMGEINGELAAERSATPRIVRLWRLLRRRDYTFRQKLEHHRLMRRVARGTASTDALNTPCIMGWYSMLIRTSGQVAPCCILQGASLGSVLEQGVEGTWNGPGYASFRRELKRTFDREWRHDPDRDGVVEPICGATGRCPVSAYYVADAPFATELDRLTPAAS